MNNNLLISIAMATYNGEKYLREQLDSIYAQSYENIEVIVTDDCSHDETVVILKQYAKSHGLKYHLNEKNLGFVKNFEKAISLCEGDYIALSDQDDIWEKDKLKILSDKIGLNLLIHSDCSIINEQGMMIKSFWKEKDGYSHNIKHLLFANIVTGCTVLLHKDLLKSALPFPKDIAYHDWWLAICAASSDKLAYTPRSLTRYRQHASQNTGAGMSKKDSFIKIVYTNIISRWNDIDTSRIIGARKQIKNLLAFEKNTQYTVRDKIVLADALIYFEDYLNHKLHFKTFYIGMKYHKILYPRKNYMFLKNILLDIIG